MSTIKALVLRTTGEREVVDLPRNNVADWHAILGGYLQAIRVPGGVMYLNEDTARSNPPVTEVNDLATIIALDQGVLVQHPGVLGNAIIVGTEDEDGNNTDVPEEIVRALTER